MECSLWNRTILKRCRMKGLISCDGIQLTHAFPGLLWMPDICPRACCKEANVYRKKNLQLFSEQKSF